MGAPGGAPCPGGGGAGGAGGAGGEGWYSPSPSRSRSTSWRALTSDHLPRPAAARTAWVLSPVWSILTQRTPGNCTLTVLIEITLTPYTQAALDDTGLGCLQLHCSLRQCIPTSYFQTTTKTLNAIIRRIFYSMQSLARNVECNILQGSEGNGSPSLLLGLISGVKETFSFLTNKNFQLQIL